MALKLDAAKWRKKRGMKRQLKALGADEELTRFVGGAIRDDLLGLPISDIDFATRLRPDDVLERLQTARIKAVPTGIDHGTITAVSDGRPVEITSLRRDGMPIALPMWFCVVDGAVYFRTLARSKKAARLRHDPRPP